MSVKHKSDDEVFPRPITETHPVLLQCKEYWQGPSHFWRFETVTSAAIAVYEGWCYEPYCITIAGEIAADTISDCIAWVNKQYNARRLLPKKRKQVRRRLEFVA